MEKITALAVFFLLLGLLAPCYGSQVNVEEVKQALSDVPWVDVTAKENVKFGQAHWGGPSDLSLRYRMTVHDGSIWLWVSIIDDKPGSAGQTPLASDHVELWVADPALIDDFAQQTTGVHQTIEEFQERMENKDDSCHMMEAGFLSRQRNLAAKLRKDHYFTQLMFYQEQDNYDPEFYPQNLYTYSPDGTEFFARIALAGLCDFKHEEVDRLAYLVDVVDVDDPYASEQKTLMSSEVNRVYDDPASFQIKDIDPPYHLPLDECEKISEDLAPNGFWKASAGGFTYVTWTQEDWSGCYGSDRYSYPGDWNPLPTPIPVPPDQTMKVLPFGQKLIVRYKGQCNVADLEEKVHAAGGIDWIPIFRAIDGEENYLILEVTGSSRWPGGSTYCGAGTESDLVWLQFDNTLRLTASEVVLYESCFQNMDAIENIVGIHGIEIEYANWSERVEHRLRVSYDNNAPAAGIITTELTETNNKK